MLGGWQVWNSFMSQTLSERLAGETNRPGEVIMVGRHYRLQ